MLTTERSRNERHKRHLKGDKAEYIGFSADEVKRSQSKWMTERKWPVKFPLIEAGMTEADSLEYCKALGYHWDGLYDVFNRVSFFCCPKGGKKKRAFASRAAAKQGRGK